MPHNASDKFLDQLIAIKDEINQQIPLAANRFEEFECPLIEEPEQDINIQFHMHEGLHLLMHIHYEVAKQLKKLYETFVSNHRLEADKPLPQNLQKELESNLLAKTNGFYIKLENLWRQIRKFDFISLDEVKATALQVVNELVPKLCAQGSSALIVDEDALIDTYIDNLHTEIKHITNRLTANEETPGFITLTGCPLDERELNLINSYRREGTPHEEQVNQLFEKLNFLKHYPEEKRVIEKDKLTYFFKDANYNIDKLAEKLKARQYTYKQRQDYSHKLSTIRKIIDSNLFITGIDQQFKSGMLFSVDEKATKKSLERIINLRNLQTGLYYQLQQSDSGFCDEHTCLGLVILLDRRLYDEHTIEKVSIRYADEDGHTFLVIDRAEFSTLNDMSTWGEKAILFDPWNKLVCYAKDLALQPRRYVSYPEGATWRSISYKRKEILFYYQFKSMFTQFQLSQNLNATEREACLIDEYELKEIAPTSVLFHYLQDTIKRYRPAELKQEIKFYKTTLGNHLVKFIPGFHTPVIALHENVFTLINEKTLSLTAFEFAITTILIQLTMYTSYTSPISISPESLQRIDILAMEKINSTDECIEYLRQAADFEQKHTKSLATLDNYETNFGGFNITYDTTKLTFLERIKLLQASIASGTAKECKGDIIYPKPTFCQALSAFIANKTPKSVFIHIEEPPAIEVKIEAYENKEEQKQETIIPERLPKTFAPTPSQRRINTLNQLLKQLPELQIELLPYEEYRAPSIRLKQYCEIVSSLAIDYNNEQEAALVDQLINEANRLKIPGFDYLYYAFASRWGVSNVDPRSLYLECLLHYPQGYKANYYYLIRDSQNQWQLFYMDQDKQQHPIALNEVEGLNEELPELTFIENGREYIHYDKKSRIHAWIKIYQGLRPLGFFKTIQQALTNFIQATCYDDALQQAVNLEKLMLEHDEHMSDISYQRRRVNLSNKQLNSAFNERTRFYGSSLGKFIKWQGFTFNADCPTTTAPYLPFINWAQQDSSGKIAALLFRLGLSNHAAVLMAMTEETLNSIAQIYSITDYVFFDAFKGTHKQHTRFNNFNDLNLWVVENKSKQLIVDDNLFDEDNLSFENAFIKYFDAHRLGLVCPSSDFNATHDAQKRLLKKFYQIACSGNDDEKAVVKSFFYGREDKRDLNNLLKAYHNYKRLKLDSPYADFVFFQVYEQKTHNLFESYDLITLYESQSFDFFYDDKTSFEQWRLILRIPEDSCLDNLLYLMAQTCKAKNLDFTDIIINRYLDEVKQVCLFSEPALFIVNQINKSYFMQTISRALNNATWPRFDDDIYNTLPIETLIENYRFFDRLTIFPSRIVKSQFGQIILSRIIALSDVNKQIDLFELWLFKDKDNKKLLPLSDISLKNTIINQLVTLYTSQAAIDDGTKTYYQSITPLINKLKERLFDRDLKPLMSKLLSALEAQHTLSTDVGQYVDPGDYKLFTSKRYKDVRNALAGLIKVADLFNEKEESQKALLEYLSSNFSQTSLNTMLSYIKQNINIDTLSDILGWSLYDYEGQRVDNEQRTDEKLRTLLMNIYYQFWDFSLYERAALIEQLFIPASKTLTKAIQLAAYEKGLNYIATKLFPQADDTSSEDYLALCIMKSYLQTADDYVRSYLLAAMLVSANEYTEQEATIGKKLAMVCEHMGPAYVKLAQAIHSHPKTSKALRADLAHIKGRANPPHRWSLWRQIHDVLLPQDVAPIKRVGKLLGSASYNLALEVELQDGQQVVLLLLRENAKTMARQGFEHIRQTILTCEHPDVIQQQAIIIQTIDEAQRLSENEMDKKASDKQSQLADQLYPDNMHFRLNDCLVEVKVTKASILMSGYGYRFIDKVYGEEFNNLPDTTPKERFLKQAIAKAVVMMELHNILRGGQFDSDRHGNQLRIQTTYDHTPSGKKVLKLQLGLYDFGEMALELPSKESLRQLAAVLKRASSEKLSATTSIDELVSNQITKASQRGQSTHYLMRLRKAFLALQDFQHYLNQSDMIDILTRLAKKKDLHPLFRGEVKHLAHRAQLMVGFKQTTAKLSLFMQQLGIFRGHDIREQPVQALEEAPTKGVISLPLS